MKALKYALPIVLAILVSGAFAGEEAKEHKDKLSGTVAAKAADAKEGVVAVLKVKKEDKEVVVNLLASGEVAEKLVKAIDKVVEVTGTKVDDTNFKVAKVKVEEKKKEGEAK